MNCPYPMYLQKQDVNVPCGRCPFCMSTRRSDWSLRLHYESRLHIQKRFLTLTYADHNLTFKSGKSQLVKEDVQKWLKRVRKRYRVRYYLVGEYGAKTGRPHYHVILFGDVDENFLRSTWNLGHMHIGMVTDASVMYTLSYIVNSRKCKKQRGRQIPFATMSRRPGIGINYLTPAMIEWHKSGRKNYAILDGEKRHLPRYYKEKIFSKIDRVRIAVAEGKAAFKREVAWLRSKPIARMRDPLAYREEQIARAAKHIRKTAKTPLII